ncbi:MAG: 2-C-methyl-D-erythritol 2,4-cyclodiphosphate synthase [Clostridia bacterium]|nr:2-C-methyl-D-erythritol 2,4-cyclodiphosphate synthase [Clostridia bacterium]
MKNWAIIVAAGKGERTGFAINKVYMPFGKSTVLETVMDTFDKCGLFAGITVVISEQDRERFLKLNRPESVKNWPIGGKNRQESVFNGLQTVPDDVDIVAVHDAARPFVTKEIIEVTIKGAVDNGSSVISTLVTDTIKIKGADGKIKTPDRKTLFAVQTPQTFRRDILLKCHEAAREEGFITTDDAALFERYYGTVELLTVAGAELNRKLTYRSDFEEINMLDIRVGHGFDAHRLVEGRKLILCGVDVPYEKGLNGHSDADVAVHALMDAILGAVALGDIGRLFPDNDPQYKGISSMLLLENVRDRLSEAGYRVSNADVTIIAQRPKLAPFIETMRGNIASILGLDVKRINVKATTTEKMGFEGAGEGISSHAVVTVVSNN